MDSGKRVWTWVGAVLAVMCAALGIVHLLLTQLDIDTLPSSETLAAVSATAPTKPETTDFSADTSAPEKLLVVTKPTATVQPESAAPVKIRDFKSRSAEPRRKVAASAEIQNSGFKSSGAAIATRPSSIISSVRPLGLVEKSDGRVQAVIQDGEWTRLVEVGEVLADNSRVLKVNAESVEILRPVTQPAIELVRAGSASVGEAETEIAVAAMDGQSSAVEEPVEGAEPVQARVNRPALTPARLADDLPGMQAGEASIRTAAPNLAISAVPQRAVKPVLPSQAHLRPSPVASVERPVGPNAEFGRVEYADGRVQTVVADGRWVQLVAEPSMPKPGLDQAKEEATEEVSSPGMDSEPTPDTLAAGAVGFPSPVLGLRQASKSGIPNSVEPIGVVEWPDGRTQAVVSEGSSVSLVDDAKMVAETRRVLAQISPREGARIDPRLYDADHVGRRAEDESATFALREDESPTRGPPGELEPPFGLPDELARGQPEENGLADPSRAPPIGGPPGNGMFGDDLPGFKDASATRIEPLQSIKIIPDALLGRSSGGVTESVSAIHPQKDAKAQLTAESSTGHEQNTGQIVLGYVSMQDGRQRAVVSTGDSVMLVDGVVDERSMQSERLAADVNEALDSHLQAGGVHPTTGEPSGSGLQSGPRIRDNQRQSHR